MLSQLLILPLLGAVNAQFDRPNVVCIANPTIGYPQTYCGFRGSLGSPNPLQPSNVSVQPRSTSPMISCRDSCLVNYECESWSFSPGLGPQACVTYGSVVADMNPTQDSSSKRVFYNQGCSNYSLTEGFPNTNFETGDLTGWDHYTYTSNGDVSVVSAESYGRAGYVAKLQGGGNKGGKATKNHIVAELNQDVGHFCEEHNYSVTFDYYIPSAGQAGPNPGNAQFTLQLVAAYMSSVAKSSFVFKDLPNGTYDNWQHVNAGSYRGKAGAPTLQLFLASDKSSLNTIFVDNIQITIKKS